MTIKLITAKLGPLTVRVVDDDERKGPADLAVVLCHGYGAPGTDLVSMARECMMARPALAGRVRFAFPEAPHALDGAPFGGRQWWPIDVDALMRRAGDALPLARETPPGLADARKQLRACVEALATSSNLPMGKIVLGGFSQGAMLATDLALRLDEAPAGLAVLSGALVGEEEWKKLAPRRRGLKVFQSHGDADPILPYQGALALKTLLDDAGLTVSFTSFHGGHGIDGDVLENLAAFISSSSAAPSTSSSPSSSTK